MLSPTDNSYSSPLPKPAAGGLLDDPSGTASTQPIAKPKPATQPLALAPDAPSAFSPSAPTPTPSPIAPPPAATPDPLAFAPQTPTPVPSDPNGMPIAGVLNGTTPAPSNAIASAIGAAPAVTPQAPTPTPSLSGGSLSGGTLNPTPAIPTPPAVPTTDPNGLPASTSTAPSTLPAVPAPVQAPVPSAPSAPAPIPTDANGMPSYSTTPTTPDNSLLNSTITPGPATDRYAIAQKEYNDWVAQSDPQFQAQMRDANRYSAAAGRIGSGQATNSIGDIQTQRENATRAARDNFLGNALTGSIDDAYKNVGIAQQQQGFQAGQQQTAFGQNVELQQLANSEQGQQYAQMMQSLGFNAQQIQQAFQNAYNVQQLSNSQDAQSFYQALEQEIQGSQGDPAQILAWISGQYARGGA